MPFLKIMTEQAARKLRKMFKIICFSGGEGCGCVRECQNSFHSSFFRPEECYAKYPTQKLSLPSYKFRRYTTPFLYTLKIVISFLPSKFFILIVIVRLDFSCSDHVLETNFFIWFLSEKMQVKLKILKFLYKCDVYDSLILWFF